MYRSAKAKQGNVKCRKVKQRLSTAWLRAATAQQGIASERRSNARHRKGIALQGDGIRLPHLAMADVY